MHPGARPHVDDIVGKPDRILVMLDNKHGVAKIAKPDERGQKTVIVTLVKAD